MMKKLLILMLVFGIASSANAALTLVSSAGDTLDPAAINTTVIGIHNDTAAPGQGLKTFLAFDATTPGGWTGVENIHSPPSLGPGGTSSYFGVVPSADTGFPFDADLYYSDLAVPAVDPYGIGVLADYEFECTGFGDVVIYLYSQDMATVLDTITIHQIPEPATMLLLGLGGLFLRRRR